MHFAYSIVYFVAYSVSEALFTANRRTGRRRSVKKYCALQPTTVRKTNRSTTLSCE